MPLIKYKLEPSISNIALFTLSSNSNDISSFSPERLEVIKESSYTSKLKLKVPNKILFSSASFTSI
jgi:ATP-dependent Lon protease